jgi:hypothetical protein
VGGWTFSDERVGGWFPFFSKKKQKPWELGQFCALYGVQKVRNFAQTSLLGPF